MLFVYDTVYTYKVNNLYHTCFLNNKLDCQSHNISTTQETYILLYRERMWVVFVATPEAHSWLWRWLKTCVVAVQTSL